MAVKSNERVSTLIDYSGGDQTIGFNSLFITTTGTLKYDDASGNTIIVTDNIPVGKFEVQGTKIYQTGTTLSGIALGY